MNEIHPLPGLRRRSTSWLRAGATLTAVALLAACGSDDDAADSTVATTATPAAVAAAFTVVVSDQPIADLVRLVAGPAVRVSSVVPVGADRKSVV